ncbi:MAG TPA: hypothetical protein VLA15_08250 [Desulfurivibrionaceae bacterium]|nr:hypothetical protein [Desulfurivibrionaceae bacterium]
MIRHLLPAVVGVVLSAGLAQAGTFGLSFNDNSAQLGYSQKVFQDNWGYTELMVRGLYNDRKDTELVSVGLEVLGPINRTGLELGAGARGYYADSDGDDIIGAGLGGVVRFVPPGVDKLKLSGNIYYCPKIFTGMDGERLWETEIAAAYEFVPRAAVFITYTVTKGDFDPRGDERTMDDSLRGGLALSF